jgi:hypothetical protein
LPEIRRVIPKYDFSTPGRHFLAVFFAYVHTKKGVENEKIFSSRHPEPSGHQDMLLCRDYKVFY